MVPYSGNQGHKLLSKMKKQLKKTLPGDVNTMISYKSTKLSIKFPFKDRTDFQHKNNVVYHSKFPSEGCHENYIGETNRRIVERIQDHSNRGKNCHLLKHAREKGHTHVWENGFKVLGNNYQSNIKRKISESLFIRQLKLTLNAMKNQFHYTFLIDFFIVITLRGVLSNHLLKIVINDIVEWQLVVLHCF